MHLYSCALQEGAHGNSLFTSFSHHQRIQNPLTPPDGNHIQLATMDVSNGLVGRLAQLHSIVSKPELNDRFVLINAYLPDKNRFSVSTLLVPNKDDCIINISVKLESLKLCSEDHFLKKYPHPHVVQVASLRDSLRAQPDGTVLDLSAMQRTEHFIAPLNMNKSHRIVGIKTELSPDGSPKPVTTVLGWAIISPDNENAILEFEDICFAMNDIGGGGCF